MKLEQVLALNKLKHRDETDSSQVRVIASLMQRVLRAILREVAIKFKFYLAVLLVLSQLLVHMFKISLSKEPKRSANALSIKNAWEALPPPLLEHIQTPR